MDESNREQVEDTVISLDTASAEFSNVYGQTVGRLIVDKLTLLDVISKLEIKIIELENRLAEAAVVAPFED